MTKHEPVSSPGPSTSGPGRDLEPLKKILLDRGVTFEGARRGYGVGIHDREAILAAAQHAANIMSRNEAVTAAHSAYWRLFDERQE